MRFIVFQRAIQSMQYIAIKTYEKDNFTAEIYTHILLDQGNDKFVFIYRNCK